MGYKRVDIVQDSFSFSNFNSGMVTAYIHEVVLGVEKRSQGGRCHWTQRHSYVVANESLLKKYPIDRFLTDAELTQVRARMKNKGDSDW